MWSIILSRTRDFWFQHRRNDRWVEQIKHIDYGSLNSSTAERRPWSSKVSSGDDQLLSIVYRYLGPTDPSRSLLPQAKSNLDESSSLSFSLSLPALSSRFSSIFFATRENAREGGGNRVCLSTLRSWRESRIIKEGWRERKGSSIRRGSERVTSLWNLASRRSRRHSATITTSPHSSTIPHYSPNRFATMITGRSVVSRCNGSNPDRLYPRAGSLPPKVPPRPRPCRLEPGNRNCSISSIR